MALTPEGVNYKLEMNHETPRDSHEVYDLPRSLHCATAEGAVAPVPSASLRAGGMTE